ncbi:MAG: hypothetical protein U5K43_15280 [Halofilum sp. (in: g-proteobacteria)]|nr:hypothetical protein [Halofilum sp. (in: g-proteobacteria)]
MPTVSYAVAVTPPEHDALRAVAPAPRRPPVRRRPRAGAARPRPRRGRRALAGLAGQAARARPSMRRSSAAAIDAGLERVRARVAELDVRAPVPSTSTLLARREVPADGRALLCIADHQTAGRGRRGRAWLAPPAAR